MKKLLVLTLSVALMFGVGNAFAGPSGLLGDFSVAGSAAGEIDLETLPQHSGFAGGAAGAIGGAGSAGAGIIFNGTAGVYTSADGGGLAGSKAFRVHNPVPDADKSIGIRSESSAQGVTGGSIDVNVDPEGYYVLDAGGLVAGAMGGFAAQGTVDVSGLEESPRHFDNSEGNTFGIAAQGSMGGFVGSADAESLGDLAFNHTTYTGGESGGPGYYQKRNGCGGWFKPPCEIKEFKNGHPENESEWDFLGDTKTEEKITIVDSNAAAGAEASINMYGNSASESYRFVAEEDGVQIEGMGTTVGAFTTVETSGSSYEDANGRIIFVGPTSWAHADVEGNWTAMGGAATLTKQTANNGSGGAMAGAFGVYSGNGQLNDNFFGSAVGYSNTSVTTVQGLSGSINHASSGMQVTAVNNVPAPPAD